VEPMLRTWDLPATVHFYVDLLGFSSHSHAEGWASLRRDDVTLMFSSPNDHVNEDGPSLTGSLYFRITDVNELWDRLQGCVRICYPIETFSYGMRDFAIYDNNGYVLQFAEPANEVGLQTGSREGS
jgi:uncharacterized glyoxalase superfamily protein PhnB